MIGQYNVSKNVVHLLIITIQLTFSLLIPWSVFSSNHSQPRKYYSRTESSLARRLFPKRMILHPQLFGYVIGCQNSEVQQFGLLCCILWILQKAPEYMIGGVNHRIILLYRIKPVVIIMTESVRDIFLHNIFLQYLSGHSVKNSLHFCFNDCEPCWPDDCLSCKHCMIAIRLK